MDRKRFAALLGGVALLMTGALVFKWAEHAGSFTGVLAGVSTTTGAVGWWLVRKPIRHWWAGRAARRAARQARARRPVSDEAVRFLMYGFGLLLLACFVPAGLLTLLAQWGLDLSYAAQVVALLLLGGAALMFYDGVRNLRP